LTLFVEGAALAAYLADVARAMRFWSRLPIPSVAMETDPHGPPRIGDLTLALPVAGALIGLTGAIALLLAAGLGLPAWPAAVISVATLMLATGAMHEDALADVADGFGGGGTVERKLEIMKDPRLGTYGASALILSLSLKIALVAGLAAEVGVWAAAMLIVAAAGVSRIAGLWPLAMLPPARQEGLGALASELPAESWRAGAAIGAVLSGLLAWAATGHAVTLLAPLAAFAAAWIMARVADRQIGGQTGDVCGAATILAELAFLAAGLAPVGS
jgi:adenosylcobinamide-GDP ribazoletransferase